MKKHAGESAAIQRCQVHKRRNVLDHLTDEQKPAVAKRLNAAYALEDHAAAKQALNTLHRELMDLNPSAARSLGEGMEETLTVHRLHVPMQLRKTLASTNVIESAFSIVEQVCKNVKRWHGGDQRERWVGSGLLVAQKQFRKVTGHKQIPALIRELEALVPLEIGSCQKKKGVVEWVAREPLVSTEIRAFPVTLTVVGLSGYLSPLSFGVGSIHKLITIATPHLGSPVATQILKSQNACVQGVLALGKKFPLLTAAVAGAPVSGGIGDLQGCPTGSLIGCGTDVLGGPIPSPALMGLHSDTYAGPAIPAAYTAGQENSTNTSELSVLPPLFPVDRFLAALLLQNCSSNPLVQELTPSEWSSVFGSLDSDGVVSVVSQLNGGSPAGPFLNYLGIGDIHSEGLESLGFLGPIEQEDTGIATAVRGLLNLPSSSFALIP